MDGLDEWVLAELPVVPARVLEIGCGRGELASALEAAGHDVLAIDPVAPAGPIFRQIPLEQLCDVGAFDAVVASLSLHHIHDLRAAVERIAELAPLLIVNEFGWDLVDQATTAWYEGRRRELLRSGLRPEGGPASAWEEEHRGLHRYETMRAELERRFRTRSSVRGPHLYRSLCGTSTEPLERALIDAGAIAAIGWRAVYVSPTSASYQGPASWVGWREAMRRADVVTGR
jgi:SAM-dependent methyltransferase